MKSPVTAELVQQSTDSIHMDKTLGRISISAKILIIVAILSATAILIGATAYQGFQEINRSAGTVALVSDEVRLGAAMNQNALQLNRAEYLLAADPNEIGETRDYVQEARGVFEDRLERLRATADGNQVRLLEAVSAAYARYVPQVERTLTLAAQAAGTIEQTAAQRALLNQVNESRDDATALRDALDAYVRYTDSRGDTAIASADQTVSSATQAVVVIAVVGIAIGIVRGFAVARFGVVAPLRRVLAILARLTEGDLAVQVTDTGRRDEVGMVANTAQAFKDSLVRTREMEAQAEAAKAAQEEEQRRRTLELASRFEERVGGIVNAVSSAATELQATAQQLSAAVEETGAQSSAVAAAAEQASSNVQTVAAAAEELSAAIGEVTKQVSDTAGRAGTASEGARSAQGEVDALNTVLEQIDQIVDAIGDVAGQTNLLALNATIEAARAGDAGKGFAVVASEVKNLANQTQRMTEEIGTQIDTLKQSAARVVEATRSIIGQIQDISEATTSMASSVEQQSAATGEISRNAQEAATGTQEVSSNIAGVQGAASQTGEASHNVTSASEELAEQAAQLKRQVDDFLAEVRQAA